MQFKRPDYWSVVSSVLCAQMVGVSSSDGIRAFQKCHCLLLLHPFNSLFSRTTWVSQYHKGKTSLDLNEAKDDRVGGWQWHQLDHMQTICTSLQTDNTPTHYHSIFKVS